MSGKVHGAGHQRWKGLGEAAIRHFAKGLCQGCDGGPVEEPAQGKLYAKDGEDAGDELGGEQGVPPEFEEIVVHAHPLEPQQIAPQAGEHLLLRAARCHPFRLAAARHRFWGFPASPFDLFLKPTEELRLFAGSLPTRRRGKEGQLAPGACRLFDKALEQHLPGRRKMSQGGGLKKVRVVLQVAPQATIDQRFQVEHQVELGGTIVEVENLHREPR